VSIGCDGDSLNERLISMVFDVDISDEDKICCCCCCVCDGDDKEGDFDDDGTFCVSSGCIFNDDKTPKKNFGEYLEKLCFSLIYWMVMIIEEILMGIKNNFLVFVYSMVTIMEVILMNMRKLVVVVVVVCDGDDKEGDFDDDETSCVSSGCIFNDNKTPKKNFGEYLEELCFFVIYLMVTAMEVILMNMKKFVVVVVVVVCVMVMTKKEILMMMKHLVLLLVVHSMLIKLLRRVLMNIWKNYVFCYLLNGDDNCEASDGYGCSEICSCC
jgi:hypothetical protein